MLDVSLMLEKAEMRVARSRSLNEIVTYGVDGLQFARGISTERRDDIGSDSTSSQVATSQKNQFESHAKQNRYSQNVIGSDAESDKESARNQ